MAWTVPPFRRLSFRRRGGPNGTPGCSAACRDGRRGRPARRRTQAPPVPSTHGGHEHGVDHSQARLADLGYDATSTDGVLDSRTEHSLRNFRRDYGLTVDGACGKTVLVEGSRTNATAAGGARSASRLVGGCS
ncbi:MAG: peptidoglycan-binding domain-containing protein [Sciscionella sp.]